MRWKATCITALAAIALLAASAGTAIADEGETQNQEPQAVETEAQDATVETATPAGTEMLRVYRDPETGELTHRPPAGLKALQLSDAMKNRISRSSEGLKARVLPDGTIGIDLKGRFMSFAVATRGEDGKIVTDCVHSAEDAEAIINGEVSVTKEEPDVQ